MPGLGGVGANGAQQQGAFMGTEMFPGRSMDSLGELSAAGGGLGDMLMPPSLAALLNQPGMMPFSSTGFPGETGGVGPMGMADWMGLGPSGGSGNVGGLVQMDTDLGGGKGFGGGLLDGSFGLLEGTGQAPGGVGVGGGDALMFDASSGGGGGGAALAMSSPLGFGFDDSNMLGGLGRSEDGGDDSDDENGGSSQVRGTALMGNGAMAGGGMMAGGVGSMGGGGESAGRQGGGASSGGGSGITRATRRLRLVWTPELHHRFMHAVHQLGVNNAVPKALMQVCRGWLARLVILNALDVVVLTIVH